MNTQKALTVEETAAFTKLSKSYLYKLVQQKKIPHYKPLGKRIFFKQEEIEDFIFRNRQPASYEGADHD
jgi:excisionase family DNA binding protein